MKMQTGVIMRKSEFAESRTVAILNEAAHALKDRMTCIYVLHRTNQIVQIKPAL